MPFLLSITAIYPYAFMHGSKSDVDVVTIQVGKKEENLINQALAMHRNVKRGNRGRNAEWFSGDIIKKEKIADNQKIPFWIMLYQSNTPIYQGDITPGGKFGFIVKKSKDPRTNFDTYTVVPNKQAENEYVSA